VNARWHQLNVMPKGATPAVRLRWHVAHQKNCACRPPPASIAAAMKALAPSGRSKPPATVKQAGRRRSL
jgi:hypothetical protein